MTRIDFYVLKQKQPSNRLGFACRLIEKAYKQGHRILLHTDNQQQADTMDEMLWTWRQGSFIPHEQLQDSQIPDSPIVINHQPEIELDMHDVMVNLADDIPLFFSQFERVAEVVDPDEQNRQSARQRYRFYQERGYPLESHDIRK